MKKNEIAMNDYAQLCRSADHLEPEMFDKYEVQRGLRDKNGNGVVTGLTNVSRIESFRMIDGVKTPCEGRLWYRGYEFAEEWMAVPVVVGHKSPNERFAEIGRAHV